MTADTGSGSRWVLWLPGLVVALGAAAATAHGLYEVAVAARVPASIAWIYPLITDGLAVVAYTATARLSGSARGYAWAVVVLSAGLSGLAQAVFLASDVDAATAASLAVPGSLRFGIGAWPAVAAALAAHLLHLLAAEGPATEGERSAVQSVQLHSSVDVETVQQQPFSRSERSNGRSVGCSEALTAPLAAVESEREPGVACNGSDGVVTPFMGRIERPSARGGEAPARDRALAAAARLIARTGELPTVSEVETEAGVSRGTAASVLKVLRDDQPALRELRAAGPNAATATTGDLNDRNKDTRR